MKLSDYLTVERETIARGARNLLINLLPDLDVINKNVRPAVARLCGMKCSAGAVLQRGIFYGNTRNISVGANSIIGRGAFLDSYDKIEIGDNVVIAYQVTFITSTHEVGPPEQRMGELSGSPIVIGDDVCIAARATIGPGTQIGVGSMVSAGAALMYSVPANSLVAGVPGKVVTRLENGIGAGEMAESTVASAGYPAARAHGRTQGNLQTGPIGETAVEAARVPPVRQPEGGATGPSGEGTLTRSAFYSELETLLEIERGSLKGTELLGDLRNWDSMAALAFIALADTKLHVVASPASLATCRTVSDLVNLFPGKIA